MEPYFEKNIFIENMVILPKYLNSDLIKNLRLLIALKYPKTYFNKGFIFNIEILDILNNKINLSGQIVLTVQFQADLYVPRINHVFQGELKESSVNKYRWIEIGPLTIFIEPETVLKGNIKNNLITVQISRVNSDKTLCFGKII